MLTDYFFNNINYLLCINIYIYLYTLFYKYVLLLHVFSM